MAEGREREGDLEVGLLVEIHHLLLEEPAMWTRLRVTAWQVQEDGPIIGTARHVTNLFHIRLES